MGLLKQGVQNLKKKKKKSDERLLFKAVQASEMNCSHICEVAPVKESSEASKCHYAYMPEPKAYLAESFQKPAKGEADFDIVPDNVDLLLMQHPK